MRPWHGVIERVRTARSRLRAGTLPTLATVLLLQVSIAAGRPSYDLRALATTFGLVLLLVSALVIAAIDALVTRIARAAVVLALDARAIVVREYPRAIALARTTREVAASTGLRAMDAAARARARIRPIALALRARSRDAVASARMRAGSSIARAGMRAAPAVATARSRAGPLVSRAKAGVPRVPVPTLSLRGIRAVAMTVTMTFVFATIIGTTGLIAQRGSVALGASTTLTIISGSVTVQGAPGEDFRPVEDGTLLRASMTIRTGGDAYAVLTYFEGSTVSIDPNTTLVIRSLFANPDGSTVISMEQEIGHTWHSVTHLLNPGSRYEVRTPSATAAVRGTAFAVAVQLDEKGEIESVVETTEGTVATSKAPTPEEPQPKEEVLVTPGLKVSVKTSVPLEQPKPAPEPERKVAVTVGATASVVLDPIGRANGIKDGRVVVQTPGATVREVEGKLVITLPNIPDGKLATVVDPKVVSKAVDVETVVTEKGKAEQKATQRVEAPPAVAAPPPQGVQPGGSRVAAVVVTAVDLKKGAAPVATQVTEEQKKDIASSVKVAEAPKIVVAANASGDQGSDKNKQKKDSDSGGGPSGGSGGGGPSSFVPNVALPILPVGDDAIAKLQKAQEQVKAAEQKANEQAKQAEQKGPPQAKEAPKAEAPRVEAPAGRAQDPPKRETTTAETGGLVPRLELPRIDLSKPEAPKPEQAKPEAPKQDASKPELPKQDAAKPEAPKQEQSVEAAKQDTPKADQQKPEAPKQDAPKKETPRSDTSEPSGFVPKLELPSLPLGGDRKSDDKNKAPKK